MKSMKSTGVDTVRKDLVFLHAGLLADVRPDIKALAVGTQTMLSELREANAEIEAAEDAAFVSRSHQRRQAQELRKLLLRFGGVSRVVAPELYARLFPKHNPTRLVRLSVERVSAFCQRSLVELAKLPADHELRVSYEAKLAARLAALQALQQQGQPIEQALSSARDRRVMLRQKIEKARTTILGQLQILIGDKQEAESFFPSYPKPKEEDESPDEAPEEEKGELDEEALDEA